MPSGVHWSTPKAPTLGSPPPHSRRWRSPSAPTALGIRQPPRSVSATPHRRLCARPRPLRNINGAPNSLYAWRPRRQKPHRLRRHKPHGLRCHKPLGPVAISPTGFVAVVLRLPPRVPRTPSQSHGLLHRALRPRTTQPHGLQVVAHAPRASAPTRAPPRFRPGADNGRCPQHPPTLAVPRTTEGRARVPRQQQQPTGNTKSHPP